MEENLCRNDGPTNGMTANLIEKGSRLSIIIIVAIEHLIRIEGKW